MSHPNGLIDLRSDTVSHPTPAMRAAMANAEVGDDVFGDDPTVNRLQERAAAMTGHEDALFVASGSMGNLVALMTHCQRGHEVILGTQSHIFLNEVGGLAAVAGVQAYPIPNQPDGTLRLSEVEAAIRVEDVHHPRTRVVCVENTQNISGGVPLPAAYMREAAALAHSRGLKLHVDGARIFNAAVALGVSAAELVGEADSVMFCLSKGLCAPVGSMLCGPRDFIAEARRFRKMVGGGMRQAGVLAAAGLVALEQMVERLEDDHANARALAEGLSTVAGIAVDTTAPATNMVYFNLAPGAALKPLALTAALRESGIVVDGWDDPRFRLVTHYWVSAEDVGKVTQTFRELLSN